MNRNYRVGLMKSSLKQTNVNSDSGDILSSNDEKTKQILRKKRVLDLFDKKSPENDDNNSLTTTESVSYTNTEFNNSNINGDENSQCDKQEKEFFNVVYGKKTTKKHKTFDGDGLIEVLHQNVTLKDLEGKILGRTSVKTGPVVEGFSFTIGNFLVEVLEKTCESKVSGKSNCTNERKSEDLEPPTKKFKQQFIPLKPSGTNSPSLRYNKLSMVKDKNETCIDLPKASIQKQNVGTEHRDRVKKILHLFDQKDNETKDEKLKDLNTSNISENISANVPQHDVSNINEDSSADQKITYNVVFGKITTKKNKTYDEDGLLEVENNNAVLKDLKGHIIGRSSLKNTPVSEGSKLTVGNKEVEVLDKVSSESAQSNIKAVPEISFSKSVNKIQKNKFIPLKDTGKGKLMNYEPLIMPTVKKEIEWDEDVTQIYEVSVDACLASVLRPHQRDGVIFLYKCVMGINKNECEGAILADEMGLGKTLQCISLIWTLLKQGPFNQPVLKRVLIVAPSSLCGNWKKEFIRWLGSHRITPYVVNEKNKPKDFAKFPRATVMIISYEMFVRNFDDVNKYNFDMVVCDEGHRLKNSDVKALKLLNQLETRKRILLTGTPVQNDLQELYTLADFVNPGIFEDRSQFKKYYENPVVAAQLPDASEEVLELGQERAKELHECTKLFTLRRTNDLINKYLPQKHELVIFCRFTGIQKTLYNALTNDWLYRCELPDGGTSFPLTVINNLKKVCNHPNLLQNDKDVLENAVVKKELAKLNLVNISANSGKFIVLQALLRSLKSTPEKIVLISYFTQTLDIMERVCSQESMQFCRLDGSTSTNSRMQIVENFNSALNKNCRVFLLSAKAGGVGLNLPGASRLVLFDSDWNPANDAQAMARIWREGQKRPVYIYRFLTTGTIEEKIYQRQISKTGLSEAVVDSNHMSSMKLSLSELRDLFTLVTDSNSITHDLMGCLCDTDFADDFKENEASENSSEENSRDSQLKLQEEKNSQHLTINQLLQWKHYKPPIDDDLLQDLLLQQAANQITFIFKNSSQPEL